MGCVRLRSRGGGLNNSVITYIDYMPLGILTDDQLEAELIGNDKKQNTNARIVDQKPLGRNGKEEVPESARKLIGEMAINGASPEIISKEFGISPSSISAYKNGATSTATYNQPDPQLKDHVTEARNKIVKRARRKLLMALDNIDDEKLSDCKPRDLAGIAKDMSAVIKNMEPEKSENNNNGTQFIFLVPPMKKESDYPTIDVLD